MPKQSPQMRAPTTRERIVENLSDFYNNIKDQPLLQISNALGISELPGIKGSMADSFIESLTNPKEIESMPFIPGYNDEKIHRVIYPKKRFK